MAHTPIEAVPSCIKMQRLAHAARVALVPPAIGAHDPRCQRTAPSRGAKWSGA